ncbi:POL2 protein, partial [Pseudoatta argentina]
MLIDSEGIIKSWKKLKEILRDEFIDKINNAQIHDMLTRDVRCYNCGGKGHKTKDCKKKELGKKCFKCKKYGHTANLCNASDNSEAVADKKTTVINTVIDSLSVVPNEATNSSVIIGSDFLAMTEMTIYNDGITIRRATPAQLLTQINVIEKQPLNIGDVREEVETIVEAYQVNKCKTTDVSMRICTSEYASLVVVVRKKDGSPHVCIDYRKLNGVIEKDGHLLPLIEGLLDKLEDASSDYGLQINFKKCQFVKRTIEFLGHIVEGGKIYPFQEKVKAVIDYPEKELKDIQSFLGLTGYFRKFIPSYSTIAKPLRDMLRKDQSKKRKGIARVDLEALAIIEALRKFRVDLLGIQFKIITDCAAFQRTMSKKKLSTRIARWALVLEDYDYIIEHRPGTRMKHIDTIVKSPIIPQIRSQQANDEEIQAIKEIVKDKSYKNYHISGDLLYKFQDGRDLLVIPRTLELDVIRIHEKGHMAAKRTEERIRQEYFIRDLRNKVERHIASCIQKLSHVHGFNIAYKPMNKMNTFIKTGKDSLPKDDQCGVVYKINCLNCESSYVSQTKRKLKTRIKEHKADIKKPSFEISVVSRHRLNEMYELDWDNIRILDTEQSLMKRRISEMIHIKRQTRGINKQNDTEGLPVYLSLLKKDLSFF